MKISERYLYQEMMGPFMFGFFAFASFLLGPQLLKIASKIQSGLPVNVALEIILWGLPQIVSFTLPMSMLLATMLSLGKMSGHSEIIAMRAGGINIVSLAKPFILTGLFVSVLALGIQEKAVPYATNKIKQLELAAVSGEKAIKQDDYMSVDYDENGDVRTIIYAKEVKGKVFTSAVVTNMEKEKLVSTVNARQIYYDKKKGWFAEDGQISYFSNDQKKPIYIMRFTSGLGATKLSIKSKPEELAPNQIDSEKYTFHELRKTLINIGKFPQARQLWIQLHDKISIPFAALVFAIIGVPLGIRSNRKSSSVGFGFCVVIIMIYYLMLSLGSILGNTILYPVVAAWWQNIIIGGYGIYRIIKLN